MPSYDLIAGIANILGGAASGYSRGKDKARAAALAQQRAAGQGPKPMTDYQTRMLTFHEGNLNIRRAAEDRAAMLAKASRSTINRDIAGIFKEYAASNENVLKAQKQLNEVEGKAGTLDPRTQKPLAGPAQVEAETKNVSARVRERSLHEETILKLKDMLDNPYISSTTRMQVTKHISRIKRKRAGGGMDPHRKSMIFEALWNSVLSRGDISEREIADYLKRQGLDLEEFTGWVEKER